MKTVALCLALATIALGTWCVVQRQQLQEQHTQMVKLRADAAQQAQALEEAEAARQQAERQHRELALQTEALTTQLQAERQAVTQRVGLPAGTQGLTAPAAETQNGNTGFGKLFTQMMQDPEAKKFIREQQRVMLDQMYDPLIKRLGLSPQEASQFKDLLAEHAVQSAEQVSSLMSGSTSSNRLALATAMTAQQGSFDEQLKAVLGEERYAQYKDYQLTVGERTQLNLFKQQNAGGENPLSEQQTEQLLGFMREEKQNASAAGEKLLGASDDQAAQLDTMLSADQTDKLLQSQEALNQKVYARAGAVLSPEQLQAFGRFQTNQLQLMRMGLTMARKMMGADNAPAPANGPE